MASSTSDASSAGPRRREGTRARCRLHLHLHRCIHLRIRKALGQTGSAGGVIGSIRLCMVLTCPGSIGIQHGIHRHNLAMIGAPSLSGPSRTHSLIAEPSSLQATSYSSTGHPLHAAPAVAVPKVEWGAMSGSRSGAGLPRSHGPTVPQFHSLHSSPLCTVRSTLHVPSRPSIA